jgi:hypothetical protein
MMADVTGAYASPVPTISQNTAAIIKYRNNYASGTALIALPLKKGERYIINSVYTEGNTIQIGFSENGTSISDERFTFTVTTGPIDLSLFFGNAPFTQYKNTDFLLITGQALKTITIAYADFKG